MGNIDWLINKVSADTEQTFENVRQSSKSMTQIERYVKGEIWEYEDLIKIIEGIKNGKQKV